MVQAGGEQCIKGSEQGPKNQEEKQLAEDSISKGRLGHSFHLLQAGVMSPKESPNCILVVPRETQSTMPSRTKDGKSSGSLKPILLNLGLS